MPQLSPRAGAGASVVTDSVGDRFVSDRDDWFAVICSALLPKDAGLALHVVTGVEERSCYRYASGATKPSAHLIRNLLRSEHGFVWLSAIMDGADVDWFRDLQRAARIAAAIRAVD